MLLPLILFALMEILTCLHLPIVSLRESPYQFLSFCFVAGAKKRMHRLAVSIEGTCKPRTPQQQAAHPLIPQYGYGYTDSSVPEFLIKKFASFSIRTALFQFSDVNNL